MADGGEAPNVIGGPAKSAQQGPFARQEQQVGISVIEAVRKNPAEFKHDPTCLVEGEAIKGRRKGAVAGKKVEVVLDGNPNPRHIKGGLKKKKR